MRKTALLLALLGATAMAAQPQPAARLVKDINVSQAPVGSNPVGLATIGNITYFFAEDEHGSELWKTDGTEAGTVLVRDIAPGEFSGTSSFRSSALVIGNRILFPANDGLHGLELWASDGTADGTVLLADVSPGDDSSFPVVERVAGKYAYFTAKTLDTVEELWRTDGTPAGTHIVKAHLRPSHGFGRPAGIGAIGSTFFFRGFEDGGDFLYATDGTAEGTRVVDSQYPSAGASLGAMLLYAADRGETWDLLLTDGTSISVVHPDFIGSAPSEIVVAGGIAYFEANDGFSGKEIWRSDGTPEGTYLLVDIAEGPASSSLFSPIYAGSDRIWFATGPPDENLWTSDGTIAGTHIVKQARGASGTVSGDLYYFGSSDSVTGYELWASDGSIEGTRLVADIAPGPAGGIRAFPVLVPRANNSVFFAANNGASGLEPWITDGTPAGTHLVRNINAETDLGSDPADLAAVGGRLFFTARQGYVNPSTSLWTTDGTDAGTEPIAIPGNPPHLHNGVASGSLYYFTSGEEADARSLWRTDGTVGGTFPLLRLDQYQPFNDILPLRGGLFFYARDAEHGDEPWFTDGTVAGTRLIADLRPGPAGSRAEGSLGDPTAVAGDRIYFPALNDAGEVVHCRTDGTTAGTERLTPAELNSSSLSGYTRVGKDVFFIATQGGETFALWKGDVDSSHNNLLHRFDGRPPTALWNVDGQLLFTFAGQLWRSDGTEEGTALVRGGIHVPDCEGRGGMAAGNGLLYWYGTHEVGSELWRSDGTQDGTFILQTFTGSSFSPTPWPCTAGMHAAGGRLYFPGSDELHGVEPWVTDGSVASTHLLADVNPGPGSSHPDRFTTAGATLYFTAQTPTTGEEVWSVCIAGCNGRPRAVRK